jgi:hypothetical protein
MRHADRRERNPDPSPATLSGLRKAYRKSYGFYLFLAWSAVIAFSLMVSVSGYRENVREDAAIEAGTHLGLNLEYRAMVANLGGGICIYGQDLSQSLPFGSESGHHDTTWGEADPFKPGIHDQIDIRSDQE